MELIVIIIWLVCGLIAAGIASDKGRSGFGWFILGAMLGPFALLAIAIASPNESAQKAQKLASGQLRTCPACAEAVQAAAIKCRHCGEALTPVEPTQADKTDWTFAGLIALIFILLLLIAAVKG